MTVEEVFAKIKAHQIEGMMFHDQMRQYFDFLNLHGFKRMHEHHFADETRAMIKTDGFYLNHANKLIPAVTVDTSSKIPANWYNYARKDVDATTKRRAVRDAMAKWVDWETQTRALYMQAYTDLLDIGEVDYADFIGKKLVCDVSDELKFAERLFMELECCDYDMVYLTEIQDKYHEKFKD